MLQKGPGSQAKLMEQLDPRHRPPPCKSPGGKECRFPDLTLEHTYQNGNPQLREFLHKFISKNNHVRTRTIYRNVNNGTFQL